MERNYATQMDAARRGIVTPELKKVAEKEYMAVEDLMPLVASGKVAIPAAGYWGGTTRQVRLSHRCGIGMFFLLLVRGESCFLFSFIVVRI